MTYEINFDMDGTLVNFYGVQGWLEDLENSNPRPYKVARPLMNLATLAKEIHRLQGLGYRVNIISWYSKNSTQEFDNAVKLAKLAWLNKHMHSVNFDAVTFLPYGTPKSDFGNNILFDDEARNRNDWMENACDAMAYDANNILEVLKGLH